MSIEINCPECDTPFAIEVEDKPPAKKSNLIIWLCAGCTALALTSIAGFALYAKLSSEHAALRNQAEELAPLLDQAREIVQKNETLLHRRYSGLRRYVSGVNVLQLNYLESFYLEDDRAYVKLVNRSQNPLGPIEFEIDFLNQAGFLTGTLRVSWMRDRLRPGEIRDDHYSAVMRYGEPTYYVVNYVRAR